MSVFRYRDRSFDIDLRSESGNFSITLIRMDQSLGALCWKLKAEMRRRSWWSFVRHSSFFLLHLFSSGNSRMSFSLKKHTPKMRFLCSTSLSNVSRFQETLEILRKHPIFGFCSNTLGIHLITSDTIEKKQRNSIVHDKGPPLSSLAHCLKTIQNVSFQSSLKQNCSTIWELRFWGLILVKNVVKWDFLIYFQTLCFSSACFLCTIVQMVRYRFFGSASALLESQTKKKIVVQFIMDGIKELVSYFFCYHKSRESLKDDPLCP